MLREEMLNILEDLPFAVIWPGSWKDVGFTEREICINHSGYTYIMCDEPTPKEEIDRTDKYWDDMPDNLLLEWLKRISEEDDPELINWAKNNRLITG